MRSLLLLAVAAAVFVLFLVQNQRNAQELLRTENAAVERLRALARGPPEPPRTEDGYRFEWVQGGDLPPILVASPEEGRGVCLFAASPKGAVYAYDLLDGGLPDVTPVRVRLARAAEPAAPVPGWRPVR